MITEPALAALAAGPVIAGQYVGSQYGPDRTPDTRLWYDALDKPWFTPPGIVFAIAWTALDSLFGYSGYRLLVAPPSRARFIGLISWLISVLGVPGYSWMMFGRRQLGLAAGVTAGMVASSACTVAAASNVDRRAAWTAAPLAGWVVFALVLQGEVWRRNR
jgi:translocator protein